MLRRLITMAAACFACLILGVTKTNKSVLYGPNTDFDETKTKVTLNLSLYFTSLRYGTSSFECNVAESPVRKDFDLEKDTYSVLCTVEDVKTRQFLGHAYVFLIFACVILGIWYTLNGKV